MDDLIAEELCNMLYRIWAADVSDNRFVENWMDENPVTADGVPIRKLFISNLAQRTTYKDLQELFSHYGKIDSCFLKRNTSKSNYAFITFNNILGASKALKEGCNKKIQLHNRDLRVLPADSWHQPDSIENQTKTIQKNSEYIREISSNYELNEDSEIHKLNDDCLMHIFMFLPLVDRVRIERVCKRWRLVSQESWCNFKRLDLTQSTWGFSPSIVPREIDTPTLRKVLLRCGQFLTHINFSILAEELSRSTLTVIGRLCPNLQYINITALNISSSGIRRLAANCSNIMDLSIGHCSSPCDRDLSSLFIKNKKLQHIKFVQNTITGQCLLNLPVDSIESITLSDCDNINSSNFATAIKTFHKLHTLSVEKCVSLNDDAVRGISLCSKNLKELHLCHYYPLISANAMLQLAELTNLQSLNVARNQSVQDEFLIAIGAHCKQLKDVDISYCNVTNNGLAAITSLPNLQYLSICYINQITDEELIDMPKLRNLVCHRCPRLNDEGLCILVEESPNLSLLDVSGCSLVGNDLVEAAITATKKRNNGVVLKMLVGETNIDADLIKRVSPLLQVINIDMSERFMIPEMDELLFFDSNDSDSDDDDEMCDLNDSFDGF